MYRTGARGGSLSRCTGNQDLYDARKVARVRGDVRLSAKKRSETKEGDHSTRSNPSSASEGKARKQRSGDLGRALRTIYDDTLREPVPDDFANLIGKLS